LRVFYRRFSDGRIQHIFADEFAGNLVSLLDKGVNGRALHALRMAKFLKYLVQPGDLVFGLFQVVFRPFDRSRSVALSPICSAATWAASP
jgi:hypothetical protein